MSRKNVVSDSLVEFHRRMAAGGVAMTTVSYVAVSRDAMGAPGEIYVHDAAGEGLAHIASVVHSEGARIAAQLGHAGAVGVMPGKRVLGPSRTRTLMGTRVEAISKDGIDEVVANFAAGGRLLADSGFDSVELHFGHHYLISAFMSPKWNKRIDEYGGSVENRSLLAKRILRAVREAVGEKMAITAKMNMTDGVRTGLQIEESIEFAKIFEREGVLDAIELTGGGSQVNQMYMFRGDAPRRRWRRSFQLPNGSGSSCSVGCCSGSTRSKRLTSCRWHAGSGRAFPYRSSSSAASTPCSPFIRPWRTASNSWRWAVRSCGTLTSSTRCATARRPKATASIATSAW